MRSYLAVLTSAVALLAATPAAAEGFRAEIHGGWDHTSADDEGDSGVLYGIGIGYDFDIGQKGFVGVEANLDDSTMKECDTSVVLVNDALCLRAGRDISVGLRGGVKVSEAGKIYALAGYTNARYKFSYTTPAGVTTSDSENLDGFRLGAGYQHDIGGNAYGKVEYRYSNYEADVSRHQVLLGVGVNF